MRKSWRWIPVTSLSLIVLLCARHEAGTPIIDKSSVGRSHSHHHHATPRSESSSM